MCTLRSQLISGYAVKMSLNICPCYCTYVFVISKVTRNVNESYNLGHNILELYNVLVQIRLTTSKTRIDIQYSKLGIQVASPVAERLRTLENTEILGKSQIWVEAKSSAQFFFQKLNFGISRQKHAKVDIKRLFSAPVLLDLSILFQIFCPGLQ